MNGQELLANIDVVRFPADKNVLLGHTDEVYSVGVIQTPFDGKSVVVSLQNEISRFANALSMKPESLINALEVIIANDRSEAMEIAIQKLQTWANLHSGDNKLVTPDKITGVVKDAPLNEPHMHDLEGVPLNRNAQLSQEQKLGYIRDHSYPIPIQPIITALLNELA